MAKSSRPRSAPEQRLPTALQAVNLHAAGIDIGAAEHWVAVPADSDPEPMRPFPAHTAGRLALAAWLTACGITTVALESTGVLSCRARELGYELVGGSVQGPG